MWYVLCELGDLAAMWAFRGLRDRGLEPVEIVSGEELACALRIEHRVGASGVSSELRLARGLTISSSSVRGVLNRLVFPPVVGQGLAASTDREYAQQEALALAVSWLHALPCPVLGRSTAQGICGPWLHLSEWVALAAQAGLRTPPYRRSSADVRDSVAGDQSSVPRPYRTVFAAFDSRSNGAAEAAGWAGPRASGEANAVGEAPSEVRAGVVRLASLAGASLLGVAFGSGWTFASASPMPDLREGGAPLLDLVAFVLGGQGTAR